MLDRSLQKILSRRNGSTSEQVYQFYFIPRAFSSRYNLCQVRHGSRDVGLLQGYDTAPGIQVRHDLVPREEPAFADLQGAEDETRSIH